MAATRTPNKKTTDKLATPTKKGIVELKEDELKEEDLKKVGGGSWSFGSKVT